MTDLGAVDDRDWEALAFNVERENKALRAETEILGGQLVDARAELHDLRNEVERLRRSKQVLRLLARYLALDPEATDDDTLQSAWDLLRSEHAALSRELGEETTD